MSEDTDKNGSPPDFDTVWEYVFGPKPEIINLTPLKLAENWQRHKKILDNNINFNPYLKKNFERNFHNTQAFVRNLPLVHAIRNVGFIDKISGIGNHGLLSRKSLEEKDNRNQLMDGGGFDHLTGLDRFISTSIVNITSFQTYGLDILVLDPNVLNQQQAFFVPASDTVMYRPVPNSSEGMYGLGPLNDSLLPINHIYEWLATVIASYYQSPVDYLTQEVKSLKGELSQQGVPPNFSAFIQSNNNAGFSPEIRVARIPKEFILGYSIAGGTNEPDAMKNISVVRTHLPKIDIIDNPKRRLIDVGSVIHHWFEGKSKSAT